MWYYSDAGAYGEATNVKATDRPGVYRCAEVPTLVVVGYSLFHSREEAKASAQEYIDLRMSLYQEVYG